MRMVIGRKVLASHEKRPLVHIIYVYFEPRRGRLLVLTTLLLYVLPCTCPGPPLLSFADIGKSPALGVNTYFIVPIYRKERERSVGIAGSKS